MTSVSWEWDDEGDGGSAYITDGLSGLDWEVKHGEESSEIEIFANKILDMAEEHERLESGVRGVITMIHAARYKRTDPQAIISQAYGMLAQLLAAPLHETTSPSTTSSD